MLSSSRQTPCVYARYLDFLLTIYSFSLYIFYYYFIEIIDLFLNIKSAHIFRGTHLIRMRVVYRYLRKEIRKEGIKTCRAAKSKKSEEREWGWQWTRLWLPVVLKQTFRPWPTRCDAVKLHSMQQRRHRQCSSSSGSSSGGQGLVGDEVVVEIHGVLCGNNTRQNERSPRFSKNISTAETRSQF